MYDHSRVISSQLASLNFNWHSYNAKLDNVYREIFNLKQIGRQMSSDMTMLKYILYNHQLLATNQQHYGMVKIHFVFN